MSHPQGQSWDITTDERFQFFSQDRVMRILAGKKVVVQFVDEDRTLDQNALSFALYKQIASQINDQSVNEVRAECKLTVGVRLLMAADEGFADFCNAALKKLNYEQRLASMEYVPVTSLMGKKVFSEYLDEVIRKYSQQGLSLINPAEVDGMGGA